METRKIIIFAVVAALMLVIGFLGGMWWGGRGTPQTVVSNQTTSQTSAQVVKDLTSKVIPSIAAYGKVTKIDGKNITLSYQGDALVVPIRDDAKIYSFTTTTATGTVAKTPTSKEITFQELKVGDDLSINVRILATGKMEGFSVVVLPPPAPAAPATK